MSLLEEVQQAKLSNYKFIAGDAKIKNTDADNLRIILDDNVNAISSNELFLYMLSKVDLKKILSEVENRETFKFKTTSLSLEKEVVDDLNMLKQYGIGSNELFEIMIKKVDLKRLANEVKETYSEIEPTLNDEVLG